MAVTTMTAKKAAAPLSPELLRRMDAYWRAANYLSVGQIYLMSNPLLKEPLQLKDVKPRLLGHKLIDHKEYIARTGEDLPEVRDWKWES